MKKDDMSVAKSCGIVLNTYLDGETIEIGEIVDEVNRVLQNYGHKKAMDGTITRKLRAMKALVNLYGIRKLNPKNSNTLYQVDKTGRQRIILKGA